ncbi:MAG: ABC transporter ATP-binding protein [bacterium]
MNSILVAESVEKKFVTGKNLSVEVLKGLSLEIRRGEVVVIMGPSGSGKSTLLHLLSGLDRPTKGRILFDGVDLGAMPDEALATFRNKKLGFIFQFHHLLPEFTALENVAMPSLIGGETLKAVTPRAKELLNEVGLSHRFEHKPSELSGGEQQRVAVARALMNSPEVILADEPSGNLDEQNSLKLHQLLMDLVRQYGLTLVFVTHNPDLAGRAGRMLQLIDGKITALEK